MIFTLFMSAVKVSLLKPTDANINFRMLMLVRKT